MAKGKMPPQLLEYFKNKNKKKEDGSEKMTDKEKRKEALDKAKDAKSKKMKRRRKIGKKPSYIIKLSLLESKSVKQ